jgi:transglutaminase-like putative cysteine protease
MGLKFLMRGALALAAVGFTIIPSPAQESRRTEGTFKVVHTVKVTDIPPGSESVRIWFWLPDDDEGQKVLDLAIQETPATIQVARDPTYGSSYLYAEIRKPEPSATIGTSFTLIRREIGGPLNPARAGALTPEHRLAFAEHLRRDCPKMEVSARIVQLAAEICGSESNLVKQTRLIYDYVVGQTNHYSLPGAPRSSGEGSAEYCLNTGGGGCSDQHALFIALARARGIPTRVQFGTRLPAKNEGKEVDPGYRCWVQYFVPNYGWISSDLSAGNTTPAERDQFASGLDCRRIHFSEGRDLQLNPPQSGPRVNLLIGAYVEVDGKPHAAFERRMKFETVDPAP